MDLISKARRFWRMCLFAGFFTLVLSGCSSQVEILSGLSEADANETLGALYESGIAVDKRIRKDGIALFVAQDSAPRALQTLQSRGLPKRRQAKLGEVFKKENLISTPLEERARYLYALSQELENTLSQFEGVIAARVHVVLPERVAPGEPIQPSSAAVYIKHNDQFDMEPSLPRVRQMVANSIPGLQGSNAQKVTIVLEPVAVQTPTIRFEDVWFFQVEKNSATALRLTLYSLLFTCVAFALALFALGFIGADRMGQWLGGISLKFNQKAVVKEKVNTKDLGEKTGVRAQ